VLEEKVKELEEKRCRKKKLTENKRAEKEDLKEKAKGNN
jgi:hypothetical protein